MSETHIVSETYNVGPGRIADTGTDGGPQFALSSPALPAIQKYVMEAQLLPKTKAELEKALGTKSGDDATLDELIAVWKAMSGDAKTWQDVTFKEIVSLASRIYGYGIQAEVYYGGVKEFAQKLIANPNDEQAKTGLKALLEGLQKAAQTHATEAAAVEKKVETFANSLEGHRIQLIGPDKKSGLAAAIQKKHASFSGDAARMQKEAKDLTATLQGIMDEYNHNVTVAATTPTYAWVSLIGTVIAVVIAGVYGARATEALRKHQAATEKIKQLNAAEEAALKLGFALDFSSKQTDAIGKSLIAAEHAVQAVQGAWKAIADDLGAIIGLIDEDIRKAAPVVMRFGVDVVVKNWKQVAAAADKFRQTAYVKVVDVLHAAPDVPVQTLHEIPPAYAVN